MLNIYLLYPERNAAAYHAALDGIEQAFKGVLVTTIEHENQVSLTPSPQSKTLLVMIQPKIEELEWSLKPEPENGLARWPVVSLSGEILTTATWTILPEGWNSPLLVQVFREALKKHDLLQENARLKGDLMTFARRISHDLRTPLSGIYTTAELLKEILAEQSAEDAALTSPLFDSAQSVLRLIERTSQVARATVEPQPAAPVDMGEIVWAGRQSSELESVKKGVHMQEPEHWPQVQGVAPWLQVIWTNLLQHAVRRSGQGQVVNMQWRELADEFEFSVSDSGPELTEAQRDALFWPFEKLSQSHSAKNLDMPIARRLVELQGGRCGCEVSSGGGLFCFFTLPKPLSMTEPVA
jgi:signal transduction histidine kinase